jgi:hypothetical protein
MRCCRMRACIYDGWDAVRRELYVNFLQKTFLERDLQASNVHITGKMANGQPMTSKGRETHVYEKTANGWRITHLHYSGLLPQQQQ